MVNISIKRFLVNEFLILITLLLCLTKFIGYGRYWNYLLIIIAFLLFFQKRIILFDFNLFWLTCFTILYAFFINYNELLSFWRKALDIILLPASFYVVGKYFSNKYPYIKITYFIIFSLTILFCLIPFLSNIISVIEKGFMSTRYIHVIWNPKNASAATVVGSFFALNMSFFALLFVSTKDKLELKLKYFSFFLFLIGLFSYMNVITRTGVFISLISSFVLFILMGSKQKIKYLAFILLLIIPIIFILNFYGVINWFEHTPYFSRFTNDIDIDQSENLPRTKGWQLVFNGLFQYPFGGAKTKLYKSNYAHNLWLEVGFLAGIIPLIPLIIFSYRNVILIWEINKKKYYSAFYRSLIICVFLGFLLSFFVEPVMEGLFINFCLFCLFFGLFDATNRIRFI